MENEYLLSNAILCMACGCDDGLVDGDMYCLDCWKRQQFLRIFNESSTYSVGSYFGKHLLEKYLGYYIDEDSFIKFMMKHDFKFNDKKMAFRTKINKKKSKEILGKK